jgi:hypothetical protein
LPVIDFCAPLASSFTAVTTSRPIRPLLNRRRDNQLVVVVLPNESTAFQAYRLLQYHGISPEHLAIVGAGYNSPERVGLLGPFQIATRKAKGFAFHALLSGSIMGLVIFFSGWKPQGVELLVALPLIGVLCGFCGAVVGGFLGFLGEGNAASIYRHHLKQGRYLLMVEGSENLVRWSQEVLGHYSTPSPF